MKCSKCGSKINKEWNYCPNCQNKLNNNIVNNDENTLFKNEMIVLIFSFICIGIPILNYVFGIISRAYYSSSIHSIIGTFYYIFFLISLIVLVSGKVMYPKSKIINITLYIFAFIAVSFISFILIMLIIVDVICTGVVSVG